MVEEDVTLRSAEDGLIGRVVKEEINKEPEVVNSILLWRIYDVMSLLLANINSTDWQTIMKLHEQGGFMTPQPSYIVDQDE
jgi:hypothetical protein